MQHAHVLPPAPCRRCLEQVVPTSGKESVTLWDAPDAETLQRWIDENMSQDGSAQVLEVRPASTEPASAWGGHVGRVL